MNFFDIRKLTPLGIACIALSLGSSICYGNDDFYPPAVAAKSAIDLDGKGFIINGQRTIISSGSIHYPRVPHELWYDRLLRLKRGSFNTVQTYAFWNWSEGFCSMEPWLKLRLPLKRLRCTKSRLC